MTIEPGPLGPWLPERCEKLKIKPKQAKDILDFHNTRNRPFVQKTIDVVKHALKTNIWEVNGETIIFARTGVLLDGQNRLYACAELGIPMTSWVVFGQDPDAFMTIDRGRNRNAATDLAIAGERNAVALVAALQIVAAYQDGIRHTKLLTSPYDTHVIQKVLKENPGIRDSVSWAQSHRTYIQCPGRLVAAVHYLAGISGNPRVRERRDEFFERLFDGVGLAADDPVLTLRDRFREMDSKNKNLRVQRGMGHLASYVYLYALIRCWNAYLGGHKLGRIQIPRDQDDNDKYASIPDVRTYYRKPSISATEPISLQDEMIKAD
jgi:hypothetical protein